MIFFTLFDDINLSLNLFSLLLIFIFAWGNLGLKWLASGRMDSVAIELAFFSLTFNVVDCVTLYSIPEFTNSSQFVVQVLMTAFSLIIWGSLLVYHSQLLGRLRSAVGKKVEEVSNAEERDTITRKTLGAVIPVLEKAMLVTLSTSKNNPRRGKLRQREECAALLNQITGGNDFNANDFALSKKEQWFGLVIFILGGTLSVLFALVRYVG